MIQNFHYVDETNPIFQLETFGFRPGGVMELNFNHFLVKVPEGMEHETVRAGFLMHLTESETTARQDIEEAIERLERDESDCWLDHPGPYDEVIDLSSPESWVEKNAHHTVAAGEEGLYSLIFVRCRPPLSAVSFNVNAKFYNPTARGPNFLSAGEAPLPTLYFAFFSLYVVAMVAWLMLCRRRKDHVHHIHHMMMALLFFKTLSLLFEAVRFHAYQTHGLTGHADGWAVVYYIFAFIKGVMRFMVILLIGTGWSLLKPYLSDKEKKVILAVLVLQVLDNTAMVVLDELSQTSPGSASWLTWRDIFHLIDILCCCAVLFPIVWSIRHLRQAAAADGKAGDTLRKLTLFRQFYLLVVAYIYFTRIVIFLVQATLPYDLLWLQALFDEGATFLFYCVTGAKFRPADANPYLAVNTQERDAAELEEFGLDDYEDDFGEDDEKGVDEGERRDQGGIEMREGGRRQGGGGGILRPMGGQSTIVSV
ncbi:protein gpr107-like [Nannochloropsis oceanica]